MRIVSLHPACTEWVAAFGAVGSLVGRSHECDYPEQIQDVPILTDPKISDGDSEEIDGEVRSRLRQNLSLFQIDLDEIARLQPDLILTQTGCDVCSVSARELDPDLRGLLDPVPDIFSFAPNSLKEVLSHSLRLGRRIGRTREAIAFLAGEERRLKQLQDRVGVSKRIADHDRPTVACVEWLEPLMTSGNWVPDLVDLAGGRAVCTKPGRHSEVVPWEEIVTENPDVIAVMPCGFSIERTRTEIESLTGRPEWDDLSAVESGRVFIFDGHAYFNRPGPRLYRSIELLTAALKDRKFDGGIEAWEMQPLKSAPKFAG